MCDCKGCDRMWERDRRERTYAIAVDGKIMFDGMLDTEMLYEYEGLMDRMSEVKIEVFQHASVIPVLAYKLVD